MESYCELDITKNRCNLTVSNLKYTKDILKNAEINCSFFLMFLEYSWILF